MSGRTKHTDDARWADEMDPARFVRYEQRRIAAEARSSLILYALGAVIVGLLGWVVFSVIVEASQQDGREQRITECAEAMEHATGRIPACEELDGTSQREAAWRWARETGRFR